MSILLIPTVPDFDDGARVSGRGNLVGKAVRKEIMPQRRQPVIASQVSEPETDASARRTHEEAKCSFRLMTASGWR